jgi:predicted nucleic acid-binding protein
MRIVVSDSSCLIDLRKASLLDAFLCLPYEFLIPNTLFDEELLTFTSAEKKALVHAGLKVVDLPGANVLQAVALMRSAPRLSMHDSFAFALAEMHPGCVLLTGDGDLRKLAELRKMDVHGVLWVLDELHRNKVSTTGVLRAAVEVFSTDATVRLPRREIAVYLKRFTKG